MKTFKNIVFLFTTLLITTPVLAVDEVVVIVNSANTQQLSQKDIKNIYSDNITAWQSGTKIKLYNTPSNSYVREIFSQEILGLSALQASATESNKRITNTLKNPSDIKRERLIAASVAKKTNAIGYVSKEVAEKRSGIRIIFTITEE